MIKNNLLILKWRYHGIHNDDLLDYEMTVEMCEWCSGRDNILIAKHNGFPYPDIAEGYQMKGSNLYLEEPDAWLYKDKGLEQKIHMMTEASGYPNHIPLPWCNTTFLGWWCPDMTSLTLEYWRFWDIYLYEKIKTCKNIIVP